MDFGMASVENASTEGTEAAVPAAKYQKLAKAYGDLKAKNTILKDGIKHSQTEVTALQERLDTAAKASESSAQLQGAIRVRDQQLRSMTTELDALRFQNQQLTKRVEVFQSNGDSKEGKQSKKKRATEDALQLQEEELRRQIEESERVHRTMAELKQKSEHEIRVAQKKTKDLEASLRQQTSQKEEMHSTTTGKLNHLTQENDSLQKQLDTAQEKLRQDRKLSEQVIAQWSAAFDKQKALVQQLTKTAESKNMFDDTAINKYNEFNIPVIDGKREALVQRIKQQAHDSVKSYASSFSNFLTYMEEQVKADTIVTNGAAEALASTLQGHAAYIKPLDRTFASYVDGSADIESFFSSLKIFSAYATRVIASHAQYTAQQSALASCPSGLVQANTDTLRSLEGVDEMFQALTLHMGLLSSNDASAAKNEDSHLMKTSSCLNVLEQHHDRLLESFQRKLQEECMMQFTDQATAALYKETLGAMVKSVQSVAALIRSNTTVLSGGGAYAIRGVAAIGFGKGQSLASINDLSARAKKHMSMLLCDSPDSVPYTEALALKQGTLSRAPTATFDKSTAGETSSTSIKVYQDRIAELEQEREHTLLECQLLNMKINTLDASSSSSTAKPGASQQAAVKNDVAAAPSNAGTEQLRRHYEDRIQMLTTQLQFADSKAVAFFDECRNTALRLEMLRNNQAQQGEEYKNVNGTIARLKEDLESTKRNYEEQLSTMTEHIMAMNDKLQEKDAEVDVAKAKGKTAKKKETRSRRRDQSQQDEGPQFFSTA
eukprot:m.129298 g.129298  ORF g.129298 m.129298 type:complete len:775 (+) comp29385_c0_seq1:125-2449(+)